MSTKTASLEKLEQQQELLAAKIKAHKEQTAIRYGTPFVEKIGDNINPKTMARLAEAVAIIGVDQAVQRLS